MKCGDTATSAPPRIAPAIAATAGLANTLGVTLAELFDVEERADNRDREHRKAVEKIVALVGDQDEATLQALGELLRIALKLRAPQRAVSP